MSTSRQSCVRGLVPQPDFNHLTSSSPQPASVRYNLPSLKGSASSAQALFTVQGFLMVPPLVSVAVC